MPELPEVQTVVNQLRRVLPGRILERVEILDPKLGDAAAWGECGGSITDVTRVGKQIVLTVDGGAQPYIAIHLRMTGRLIWCGASKTESRSPEPTYVRHIEPEVKHLRAVLYCRGGAVQFFDPRRFGTILRQADPSAFSLGGVDPMSEQFTAERLTLLLANARQDIKGWLLRQDRLEGIGNIYASEILFRCAIHPDQQAASLRRADIEALFREIRAVLASAIMAGGTTFSDYRDLDGRSGKYVHELVVYDREGEPCRVCRREICRTVQSGRSTYFCPACQHLRRSVRIRPGRR